MTTTLSARQHYLAGNLTHHEYYGLLVALLGEHQLRQLLPVVHTPAEWRALIAKDGHLNNVALSLWDQMHPLVANLVRRADRSALRDINGTGGWSLSDTVCVLKTTATRLANS